MCIKAEPCEEENISQEYLEPEMRFWLPKANASAVKVEAPTILRPPFPAFLFLQVPQPPLALLPSPSLSGS